MPRTYHVTRDPECHRLLADLREMEARVSSLSKKSDAESPCVGKLWGVRQSLTEALRNAESEIAPQEE